MYVLIHLRNKESESVTITKQVSFFLFSIVNYFSKTLYQKTAGFDHALKFYVVNQVFVNN